MDTIIKRMFSTRKKVKILVVGDLMLDEYIWGKVERISPEAPVQILESQSENATLGGSANVINNLAVLGCKVFASGIIGKDEAGKKLLNQLKVLKVDCGGVIKDPDKPTTNKIRVIAHNQQVLRIDREDKSPAEPEVEKEIIRFLTETIPLMDGIICSDYQKGVLTSEVLKVVFHEAKKNKKMVVIDPKGNDYKRYRGATIITPNEKEFEKATAAIDPDSKDVLALRAKALFRLLKNDAILATRGKEGMSLFTRKGGRTDIPTEAKEVYDVTGAGDTVISVFSLSLFSGCDLVTAAKIANKAAGVVVGKVGTSVIRKDELLAAVDEENVFSKNKIVLLEELQRIVSLAKNKEKKVVFTNGCFDLLHVGHIKYLEEAKKLGDILIIGLNDDRSIKKLKGRKRPLIDEFQRAHINAGLHCVDYVVIFSELTPIHLIKTLLPDILVKGGDYAIDDVVGKDVVERHGGEVRLVPVIKNVSTSTIVKSIVKKYR